MNIAILAGLSMVVQDILGTLMVQSQARNHGWLAGICDSGMWLMALISYNAAITNHGSQKVLVIIFVTAANLIGNRIGVAVGNKYIKDDYER